MAYTPDPTDITQPQGGVFAQTAAAEFRALKQWIASLTGLAVGAFPNLSVSAINSGPLYGNRTVNGACEISQINGTTAVTPVANAYVMDMFYMSVGAASKLTAQQVTDAPPGLKNSLKISVAAQYAPAAGEVFWLNSFIEGSNVIDFQLGAAGAVVITLSNWIKGSVAGTYAVSVRNAAQNRSYVGTIAVTTAWTQVKLTLTGDVTGTWLTDTGIGLTWALDLGSGVNSNTTAGAWQAGNFTRTAACVTFVNQVNGSTLNITGFDTRLGSVAPIYFTRRDIAEELRSCQRYLPSWDFSVANSWGPMGQCFSAVSCLIILPYPATPRIIPSSLQIIGGTFQVVNATLGGIAVTSLVIAANQASAVFTTLATVAAGLTAGNATLLVGPAAGGGKLLAIGCQL